MIQEMAMLEAKLDEFSAKLREAEDKCAESERTKDAQKREFEVRKRRVYGGGRLVQISQNSRRQYWVICLFVFFIFSRVHATL